MEGVMYTHCKNIGITLFTVSHRKSLWRYHEYPKKKEKEKGKWRGEERGRGEKETHLITRRYVLQFDGHGAYDFKSIDPEVTTFGS